MVLCDVSPVDDDNFDIITRVEFNPGQDNDSLLKALGALTITLRRGQAANRYEQLVGLELTSEYCQIRLRYFTKQKRNALGLPEEAGYDDVVGLWYLRYLFAVLNSVRLIEHHPWPRYDLALVFQDPYPFDEDLDPQ